MMARPIKILANNEAIKNDIANIYVGESIAIQVVLNGQPIGSDLYFAISAGVGGVQIFTKTGTGTVIIPAADLAALVVGRPYFYTLWAGPINDMTVITTGQLTTQAAIAPLTAVPVAPVVTVPASVVVTDNGATMTYVYTAPTVTGLPVPTITPVLTLDGVNVTAGMSGLSYVVTKTVSAVRPLVMTFTAANGVLPNVTSVVTRTVPAGVAPVVTVPASVVVTDNGATVTYAFVEPTVTGVPASTITPVLTLDGVNVTAGMSGLSYVVTKTVSAVRPLVMTFTAANGVLPNVTSVVTRTVPAVAANGIFGFPMPSVEPTVFPGNLIVGTERTATDATKWARQNNDAALSIAPGAMASNGTNAALRWIGYTDESVAAVGDRLAIMAKIDSAGGNISISSSVGSVSNTANTRIGWKQGVVAANAPVAPRISVSFNALASGLFSEMRAFNLKTLLAQKWFVVLCAGQSNLVGAATLTGLNYNIDGPVEGCVVFPGAANAYVGAEVDGLQNGLPMIALDPINHQTLNGSVTEPGGGPCGSYLRELRKYLPSDYTIVLVATSYAGQGFKTNGFWNKLSTNKSAYDGFWKQARQVWAQAPVGSVMGGFLFCGGESDLGSGNEVEWQSTVTGVPALINEVRAEPNWGNVPLIFMEIGMDIASANVLSMTNLQKKLRTGSGDALEYSRCKYVARPAVWTLEADATHYTQTTHRQRGIDCALAHRDIIYNL